MVVEGLFIFGMPFNIRAQKIDGTTLDTDGMVVAAFSVTDKANRVRFFEKTFLVANTLISWIRNSDGGLIPTRKPSRLPDVSS